MNRLMLSSLLIAGLLLTAAPSPAHAGVAVSVGFFHDELSPYGRWVPCDYGDCWVPASVGAGWQPYSNGEWIYTDYGWTWVSYDPWGGDPFHYGSWYWFDDAWAWVPGTVWGPAWVTWGYDADDIGWAPLPPSFAFTATGYFGSPVVASSRSYVFVPTRSFAGVNTSTVRIPAAQNAALLPRMRAATAFNVSGGVVRNTALPLSRVESATGRRIPRQSISAARTDPRPVPRTAANSRMSLTAPAKTPRAGIGNKTRAASTRTANSKATPKTAGQSRATVKNRPLHRATAGSTTASRQPARRAQAKSTRSVRPSAPVSRSRAAAKTTPSTRTRSTPSAATRSRSTPKAAARPASRPQPRMISRSESRPAPAPREVSRPAPRTVEHSTPAPRAETAPAPRASAPPPRLARPLQSSPKEKPPKEKTP